MSDKKPVVGVAWHNRPGETCNAVFKAIETAGGVPIELGQVLSADLEYDDNRKLKSCIDADGALTAEAAMSVRRSPWHGSNAEEVMEGINAIVFPGGGDMSPSLFYEPEPVRTTEGFCAERDVSDFILMSYCLEKDIPVLAICRGMQVLAVVSDAGMIQDIPDYMERQGKHYNDAHRNKPAEKGAYRDFAFHDVTVTDRDSIFYSLTGQDTIYAVPSWHHQAVKSVEGTKLKVTGVTETGGEDIIEAVERPDKTFVLGLQYHPEIAVVRELDDVSLAYFTKIVDMASCK